MDYQEQDRPFLAHIAEDGRTQTIAEHAAGTGELSAYFASAFGAGEYGAFVGRIHDIGKYSQAFQNRIRGDPARVDHSTAGALESWKEYHQPMISMAVAGHHAGLADLGTRTAPGSYSIRMQRAMREGLKPYSQWKQEISLPVLPKPPVPLQDAKTGMFFTRMLYSCLVDADYLDTERFMNGSPQVPEHDSIETLADRLDAHCAKWFPPKGELNERRCAILRHCQEQGDAQKPGLFTLTVPTGGGKTTASLAFALHHAKKQGFRRVIYVIPYTSIIEQNAAVFREILGEANVLEHHSGVVYEDSDSYTPNDLKMRHASENWDVPIVVTTAVQFFESLFSNRPSQCRKLHNIAESVIIFDEAQMLPLPYLQPCVFAISQLIAHYRASAVLCTATQPALDDLFRRFLPNCVPTELCPEAVCPWDAFQRTTFRRIGRQSWEELAAQLQQHPQVLCIVNTRKSAQLLYERLAGEGTYHLSTLMTPSHRREILATVRSRLRAGLSCRVVSTSLIEAGVDVDFPAVYREEAGLDSILQAAGRCNREGTRPAGSSIVTVFSGETAPPPLFSAAIGAGREALARFPNPASREAVACYFQQLLYLKGEAAQDQKQILSQMQRNPMCFETVAREFHLIDSRTVAVYIPTAENAELFRRLRAGERSRALFRKLNQYAVNIYPQHYDALLAAGDLELLEGDVPVLTNPGLYDANTGLSLDADFGKALFV